ncbi:hypothetical protein BC936DRAFT_138820 [Jimgerdemannia flammicorona]|uniref:Uncharacterized protein n=1 Tax=Jimgerdemannia flammicorona TaxID=994334 RepID=A0A433BHI7_9FUNG|nr:hypothetical protein BC936DRAFT_138820 [Jimgerdemannia flammicorona]
MDAVLFDETRHRYNWAVHLLATHLLAITCSLSHRSCSSRHGETAKLQSWKPMAAGNECHIPSRQSTHCRRPNFPLLSFLS